MYRAANAVDVLSHARLSMITLLHDIRYAWRVLLKAAPFTALIVITLALGIGVNTAIFSVVHAMLFEPFADDEVPRLVELRIDSRSSAWAVRVKDRSQGRTSRTSARARRRSKSLVGSGRAARSR